ncbi:MAG: ATP-binding cassette domain-containing protein [Desulfobacteraceae bacterium]|jgi:phospholipid/cholesterol/gamma-HCH transport system ATP-binding protein|nr:MAG: ATP-binding cassette domain-containing protein [Desulfobacteraceae bacterium]
MIEIIDIHKSFGRQKVLSGLSISIDKGSLVAVLGSSGSGKSVLLKHVAGLLRPDRGKVLLDGQDIHGLRGKTLASLRDRMGFLFQGGALFDSMTVFENVAFPLKEKTKLYREEIRDRVLKTLEAVGLSGSEDKYPSQLSGGMIKRAAMARALVRDPEIMMFDEPTTGLDPAIRLAMLRLIDTSHKRFGFTGIIVTHEIPSALAIVDHVVFLKSGSVYARTASRDFLSSSDPVIKEFLGRDEGPEICPQK